MPTENLRFREESLTFKVVEQDTKEDEVKKFLRYQYPAMKKTQVRQAQGHALASRARGAAHVVHTLLACSLCNGLRCYTGHLCSLCDGLLGSLLWSW